MGLAELLSDGKLLRKFNKIVTDRTHGTLPAVQATINHKNPSRANQQTRSGERHKIPTANLQTLQPETKRLILTDAQYTQRSRKTPAVTINSPLNAL